MRTYISVAMSRAIVCNRTSPFLTRYFGKRPRFQSLQESAKKLLTRLGRSAYQSLPTKYIEVFAFWCY
ncbi:MAG TPA: hypothetical protein DHU55_13705 [Blastocatellia bacterium]|nr:hypothetical protein [Blastocatellia bacterium]